MTEMSKMNAKPDSVPTERPPAGVPWHDLTSMSRAETLREVALPVPWLVASWLLYGSPFWIFGPVASFMFFLCALRLNHEAIHSNLGLPRWGDRLVLHALSFLMGASNNAVAHGHLIHHKHAMGPADFEGKCGHMSLWQVLCYGPRFPLEINRAAWLGSKPEIRRRIVVDWALNALMVSIAFISGGRFLMLHVAAMLVAQCFTALFAVWITHRGTEAHGIAARSQRGILASLAYLMFYHREHHLFPKVPVRRLPVLADRLDAGVPGFATSRLPVVPLFDRKRRHHPKRVHHQSQSFARGTHA